MQINVLPGVDFSNVFWGVDRSWTVVNNTGTGSISGTFLLGGTVGNSQGSFSLASISGGVAGEDLVLNWTATAIPEPSTGAALAGLGVLISAALRRRRA